MEVGVQEMSNVLTIVMEDVALSVKLMVIVHQMNTALTSILLLEK